LDGHYCTASEVEIDPDQGCLTYKPVAEVLEAWDDDLLEDDRSLNRRIDSLRRERDSVRRLLKQAHWTMSVIISSA
jgi:hypothetical protein